ncbi:MAG: hypothetical protein ACR2HA_02415 [Nocardioides sp.]
MTRDSDHQSTRPGKEPPIDADAGTVLRARHDLLTARDHVIGLEAESANLQQVVDRLLARQKAQKERLELVREKLDRQRRRADRLQRELDSLKASGAAKPGRRLLARREPD